MLKFEEKEYDLNFLCTFTFDFQMLKELLINLAKSNQEMAKKIKKLEKSDKENTKRISNIEDQFNVLYIPDQNSYSESDNEEKNEDNNKQEKEPQIKEEKKDLKFEESNTNIKPEKKFDKKDDEEEEEKIIRSKRSLMTRKSLKELESKNTLIQQYPQVSHETIKSLLKLIRENAEKIGKIDKSLNKKLTKAVNDFDKNFNDLNTENTKEHKAINEKIREINYKLYDYNDKMDGIIVKTAPLDTLSIFRDNGSGNIDATKAMVKILEEKVNKRIEIIEKKGSGDDKDNLELKQKMEELDELKNKLNEELLKLKQLNNGGNKDAISKNYDDDIQEIKNLIDTKYEDILKIIEDLSLKIQNGDLVGDKLDDILNKINAQKEAQKQKMDPDTSSKKISELNIDGDIGDNISDLKNRIKELNKKVNEVDGYFKNLLYNSSQDIGALKQKIEEIFSILEKKITKEELKPLENKIAEHTDEIAYLQDKVAELIQLVQKISENSPLLARRIEVLTHDINSLKGKEFKEASSKPIDLSRYIDENRLKEFEKNINKDITALIMDKNSLFMKNKELAENMDLLCSKEQLEKLEDDINQKLSDLLNKINKKYVEKVEMIKSLKNLELKLKLLDKDHNKDADSWILAKQPVGCFNCASCEANIKNYSPSNEYLPWNKYPQGERQYHLGQGFSRLLQKITNDTQKNSYERKELSPENELSSNYFSNMPNIKGTKNHFFFKINNRENMLDELTEDKSKYNKKNKLPQVLNKRKRNELVPLSDDENDRNNSMDNPNSPKILKITKKNMNKDLYLSNTMQKSMQMEITNYHNSSTKNKLDRTQSMPVIEKL